MPLFILSSVIALGCSRTPAEPHPDPLPTVGAAIVASSGSPSAAFAKCVIPLASVAPPVPTSAGTRCPHDSQGRFNLHRAPIAIAEANATVDAELARSVDEGERGLMFRQAMGEEEGMFFFIDDRKIQTFWMHNTCIPLDMIFIDDDGTIVGIVESAPVLDDGARQVECASRYVLEVNAGWSRRHGVKPGQRVTLPK